MSDQLNKEEEDLLQVGPQSALATAFEPAPLSQAPPPSQVGATPASSGTVSTPPPSVPSAPALETSLSSLEESGFGGEWKSEYEAQVSEWRAKSAEQRVKAEEERKKWEEIRAKEEKERGSDLASSTFGSGWESLSASGMSVGVTPQGATQIDIRSLVGNLGKDEDEEQVGEGKETVAPSGGEPSSLAPSPPVIVGHDKLASEADSPKHDKWEDIPSELTSSYPSISFPSDPHSPSSSHHPQHDRKRDIHTDDPSRPRHQGEQVKSGPSGPTFAVFDQTLSRKTRALALFSSLAINVLLPFVNGVMLGFGEIFAKNVVIGWLGWKTPSTVASNVGIGVASPDQRSKRR